MRWRVRRIGLTIIEVGKSAKEHTLLHLKDIHRDSPDFLSLMESVINMRCNFVYKKPVQTGGFQVKSKHRSYVRDSKDTRFAAAQARDQVPYETEKVDIVVPKKIDINDSSSVFGYIFENLPYLLMLADIEFTYTYEIEVDTSGQPQPGLRRSVIEVDEACIRYINHS